MLYEAVLSSYGSRDDRERDSINGSVVGGERRDAAGGVDSTGGPCVYAVDFTTQFPSSKAHQKPLILQVHINNKPSLGPRSTRRLLQRPFLLPLSPLIKTQLSPVRPERGII
jgi:hypothetical protein